MPSAGQRLIPGLLPTPACYVGGISLLPQAASRPTTADLTPSTATHLSDSALLPQSTGLPQVVTSRTTDDLPPSSTRHLRGSSLPPPQVVDRSLTAFGLPASIIRYLSDSSFPPQAVRQHLATGFPPQAIGRSTANGLPPSNATHLSDNALPPRVTGLSPSQASIRRTTGGLRPSTARHTGIPPPRAGSPRTTGLPPAAHPSHSGRSRLGGDGQQLRHSVHQYEPAAPSGGERCGQRGAHAARSRAGVDDRRTGWEWRGQAVGDLGERRGVQRVAATQVRDPRGPVDVVMRVCRHAPIQHEPTTANGGVRHEHFRGEHPRRHSGTVAVGAPGRPAGHAVPPAE